MVVLKVLLILRKCSILNVGHAMQGTNDEASNLSYGNIQGIGQNKKLGSKIYETYYPG
jgi:hypothetical protein